MEEFLNVYNFIPFPEKKEECYADEDRHVGVIQYQIITETPLFIPNTSNEKFFRTEGEPEKHKSYDFYSYCDKSNEKECNKQPDIPVIPGSELRGMIRGIYETLTDSCMGILNTEEYPVKRTREKFCPGLIQKLENKYVLLKAKDYIYQEKDDAAYKTFKETRYKEGQKIFFDQKKIDIKNGREIIRKCEKSENNRENIIYGYLIKGMSDGDLGRKRNAHVFVPLDTSEEVTDLDKKALDRLNSVLKSYQEQPEAEENCYKEYENNLNDFYENGSEKECFPVYHSVLSTDKENLLLYLAPACFSKELSHHSIGNLAGDFAPCKKEGKICPACDLFGRVGENNSDCSASKIRFSDAYVVDENISYYEKKPVTLEALSYPKLGNTEFYLCRPIVDGKPGADFWTYDYYVADGKLYVQPGNLRGRKYYWHQPNVMLPKDVKRSDLNKTVRLVGKKKVFKAKVFFDGISDHQLNQLLWILNCGENNSDLAYKLGGGKPLGLGSVKCKVLDIKKRKIQIKDGNLVYTDDITWKKGDKISNYDELKFSSACKEAFMRINSLSAAKQAKHISYPVMETQLNHLKENGYEWYVQNHKLYAFESGKKRKLNKTKYTGMGHSRIQMKNCYSLPQLPAMDYLPCCFCKEAEVTGYKNDRTGTTAYLRIKIQEEKGQKEQKTLRCSDIPKSEKKGDSWEEAFPIGTKIWVMYKGKKEGRDGKMYDQFSFAGRIDDSNSSNPS